jgi:hypothetical protein
MEEFNNHSVVLLLFLLLKTRKKADLRERYSQTIKSDVRVHGGTIEWKEEEEETL